MLMLWVISRLSLVLFYADAVLPAIHGPWKWYQRHVQDACRSGSLRARADVRLLHQTFPQAKGAINRLGVGACAKC